MNQYELKRQTQRLIESQDKFVATMRVQFEVIESMTDHLSHFRDCLKDFREMFLVMRGLFTEGARCDGGRGEDFESGAGVA